MSYEEKFMRKAINLAKKAYALDEVPVGAVIVKDGETCGCGRNGCWESYASATALIRQTKAAMLKNKDSLMWSLVGGDIERVSGRTSFDAMRQGDETAKQVVKEFCDYVACGLTNIINIYVINFNRT